MSNSVQQAKARAIRDEFVREYGDVPNDLRAPLDAVIHNEEQDGTAYDVLLVAYRKLGYSDEAARSITPAEELDADDEHPSA